MQPASTPPNSPPLQYAQPTTPRTLHSKWRFLLRPELGLLLVVAILFAFNSLFGQLNASGRHANLFLNPDTLVNGVAVNMSVVAVMAIGMTLVIITGGIDISVGSIFGLAALTTAYVLQFLGEHPATIPLGIILPLTIGALCGLINGILVIALRIHPFIVTLGTMGIFRGIANVVLPKFLPEPGYAFPESFSAGFIRFNFGPPEYKLFLGPLLVMLLVLAAGVVFLRMTVWGRQTYAVGGNEEAARFSGISTPVVKLRAYILCGLAAGIAAMLSVGRFSSASSSTGAGDELLVIAAAVVGGASLMGGRGTAIGALLGALIIQLIDSAIYVARLNQEYKAIIVGAAIILAVAVDRLSEFLSAGKRGAGV